MLYRNYVDYSFDIDLDRFGAGEGLGAVNIYYVDGTMEESSISYNSASELTYTYVCNAINRIADNKDVLFYLYDNGHHSLEMVYSSTVDFILFDNDYGDSLSVVSGYYNAGQNDFELGDGNAIRDYLSETQPYPEFNDYFSSSVGLQDAIVYDRAFLSGGMYRNGYHFGYNENYYAHEVLNITADGNFEIAIGRPYYNLTTVAYNNGYNVGHSDGYNSGYNEGYEIGKLAGNMDQNSATAMNYIGGAFGVVNNILSIEVLPNITLGLVFSIPLVFTLITLLFKLAKK